MEDDKEQPDVTDGYQSSKFWLTQLKAAEERDDKWHKRGRKVVCRYLDERDGYEWDAGAERRINILWSNTEVLKSNLFAQLGAPDVRRDFPQPGYKNKVARTCALVLERNLAACANRYDPEAEIKDAVSDSLLPGRGQCWVEYDPTITQKDDNSEAVAYQKVEILHVSWEDFRHGPGKKWRDVRWVAIPEMMMKDDLAANWPEHAEKIPCTFLLSEGKNRGEDEGKGDFKRAKVWQIWDKRTRQRIYVAEDYPYELERNDDPYRLEGFFPCPKPLYGAVKATDSLCPNPEFLQYKDQAEELDRVNTRIHRLVEALKFRGVRFAGLDGQDDLAAIDNLEDGQFLALKNFQTLAQGGGLREAFQTFDLAPIAAAIQAAAQRAMELIQSIYEVTGISDVVRGASDPSETATAQNLKARFGSQRLQERQKEVQRFVRDLYRIKGEIIAEHFERDQLSMASGIELPTEAEKQQAKQMLAMYKQQQQMAQMAQQQPPAGPPQMLGHNNGPPMQPQQQQGQPPMEAQGGPQMPPGAPPMPQGAAPQQIPGMPV